MLSFLGIYTIPMFSNSNELLHQFLGKYIQTNYTSQWHVKVLRNIFSKMLHYKDHEYMIKNHREDNEQYQR